jgi:C-terminal processing protease CtpA/Prc
MSDTTAEAARLKVLGPAGTVVHLTILREGADELLEFDVTREKITIASSTGEMLEGDIAYIQVTTFGEKTTPELLAALNELMAQNPKGIILDLRNNGGGYLQTAVEVTSQFVSEGVVLYEQYGNGDRTTYDVESGGLENALNVTRRLPAGCGPLCGEVQPARLLVLVRGQPELLFPCGKLPGRLWVQVAVNLVHVVARVREATDQPLEKLA